MEDQDEVVFRSDMSVVLIDSMGSDLRIANAARLSLDVEHPVFVDPADTNLLRQLISSKPEHGAPFEKVRFEFLIECPIFVARQWFKHRFSSFNEVSARYSELKPHFYIPASEDVRQQVGKRMSYQYETHENAPVRAGFIEAQKGFSRTAYNLYNTLLKLGIAKEQARSVLPLNLYTRFMWGIDLRNLTNFLVLRNDKHAQLEIQHAAQAVESAFEEVCPVTYRIWNEEGRPRLAGID